MEKEIRLNIFFDGACNGRNIDGVQIGIGVCTIANGLEDTAYCCSKTVGNGTNNDAEFKALIEALKQAAYYQEEVAGTTPLRVRIFGDSQVIIGLFNREMKTDSKRLSKYLKQAHYIAELLGPALDFVQWVPREQNTHADKYSKQCFKTKP